MTPLARIAIASLLVVGMTNAAYADNPPPANSGPSAADVEEAKKHYARGVQLYNQKADAAARAELERAYALAPNWKVLYNLGLVQLQMNDFASALRSFEQYLAAGGKALGETRQREVVGRVALLREEVATIEVKVNAPDAEVLLDDMVVGTSPLSASLVVNPGHYKLGASRAGHSAESKAVNVAGGDHTVVELAIEEPAPTIAPLPSAEAQPTPPPITTPIEPAPQTIDVKPQMPETPSEEDKAKRARANALWIGWGATGVLGAGAIATGLAALGANSDLTHAKNDHATSAAELDHLSSHARTLAAVSDVLTIGALAAGGVSLYLTLRSNRSAPAAAAMRSESMRSTRSPVSVDVAIGPASFAVRGVF